MYVYDHCPFCVRVRLALGVKNVKHNVNFMANDDIPTPTALVGKKIAPIFALPQDELVMGESLDIIKLVDEDERFGPTNAIKPSTGRTDFKAWQKSVQVRAFARRSLSQIAEKSAFTRGAVAKLPECAPSNSPLARQQTLLRTLQRPRYVATGLLPEFQTLDGRHAFIKGHQLPPYEKPEWKEGDMTMEVRDLDIFLPPPPLLTGHQSAGEAWPLRRGHGEGPI